MEGIRSWAATVCLAALAAGMAGVVAPKGKLEKIYKFAVALFFLCCMLTPLFRLRSVRLEWDASRNSAVSAGRVEEAVNAQKTAQIQANLARLVTETCRSAGVTPRSVQVRVTLDADGAAQVGGASVALAKADASKADRVKEAVKRELGMDVTVTEGET